MEANPHLQDRRARRVEITKPVGLTDAIGVTVVSPKYEHLANEAESRFRKMTGLDVVRITTNAEPAFFAKLTLDTYIQPRPIVYFDVDLFFLRPFDFSRLLSSGKWCAVPDPGAAVPEGGFVFRDRNAQGWEPDQYFNSGLFVCDLRRPEIQQVFRDAREHEQDVKDGRKPKPVDSTDQIHLNVAVAKQPGLLKRLGFEMNCFPLAIQWGAVRQYPPDVVGFHAAGVPLPLKLERLKAAEMMLGPAK